jgi:prolipoprotein diacylglyceryl transferase
MLETPVVGSLPSPSTNRIGPLHAYGLMIALGVLAGIELAARRWKARFGDPNDFWSIALYAVPAGLIGARLYHVITDWKTCFPDNPVGALEIWNGGLGIPGGIICGVGVGVYVAHRKGMRLSVGLDVVAPALPLAQAIGRVGNWFNQEVFGRPTDLPWGLEISPSRRPAAYEAYSTFHPTFLYEGLWNLALVVLLIWLDRKRVIRPGNLFVLYVFGYGVGRLWVESLRSDNASLILGLRVNTWMSLLAIGASIVVLAVRGVRRRPEDDDEPYVDGHHWEDPDESALDSSDSDNSDPDNADPDNSDPGDSDLDESDPDESDPGASGDDASGVAPLRE